MRVIPDCSTQKQYSICLLLILGTLFIGCAGEPVEESLTFDRLQGIWIHEGSDCDDMGENCNTEALQDIEFFLPNHIRIGGFQMPIGLRGDTVLMGHQEAMYPVVKLSESILLIKRGETGNIMKYRRSE